MQAVDVASAIAGRVTGETDLPSSVANASIVGYQGIAAYTLS